MVLTSGGCWSSCWDTNSSNKTEFTQDNSRKFSLSLSWRQIWLFKSRHNYLFFLQNVTEPVLTYFFDIIRQISGWTRCLSAPRREEETHLWHTVTTWQSAAVQQLDTVWWTGSGWMFTVSGSLEHPGLHFSHHSKDPGRRFRSFQAGFGRRTWPQSGSHPPLLKLSSQLRSLAINLRAPTQEGEGAGPGTCYWRLTCPVVIQGSARGRGQDQNLNRKKNDAQALNTWNFK